MINLFKTPVHPSQRRLSLLLLTSVLLFTGTTAAAEVVTPTPVTAVFMPLEQHNSYQAMPKQSIVMPELSNWQDANTRVKDIGGWMFYASEGDAGPDHNHTKHQQHSEKHQPASPLKDLP